VETESTNICPAAPRIPPTRVYLMAGFCLAMGLAIGFLMRGSQLAALSPQAATHLARQPISAAAHPASRPPTLEEMKQMADRQAAPLLDKLKSDPNDSSLLVQVGGIYHTSHQFQEAADFYGQAVKLDPKNVAIRTKLASSLYRSGDIDGALAQLDKALTYEPKDANALFDLGMIRLQGKGDSKGALAAWQRLLKANPQLSEDKKATVLKLMADVMTMMGDQHGRRNAGR
jgi:cytochrome c-type biogenesis protein CcmH/NrfG